jgi:Cytidylate kinase-like family
MPVLLISRGTMSGGELIAQCLTHTANFRCVTREDLLVSVNRHGELASRVTAEIGSAAHHYERFSELRRPYKVLMRHALLEYARLDNLAYLGYSGHLLVENIAHFIRVRLVAPLDLRIRMTMSRLRCTSAEAEDNIRTADEERVRWARFMYGRNIRDPELYDLCLNLERVSIPTVCSLLRGVIAEAELQPTAESLAALEDEFLASRVLVALVNDPETFPLEIGATAVRGHVALEGPYLDQAVLESVLVTARAVPGVSGVDYQPGYAPAFKFQA